MIRKQGSSFVIKSKTGKTLGTYPTKEQALKRLRQIEYFKHQHGKSSEDPPPRSGQTVSQFDRMFSPEELQQIFGDVDLAQGFPPLAPPAMPVAQSKSVVANPPEPTYRTQGGWPVVETRALKIPKDVNKWAGGSGKDGDPADPIDPNELMRHPNPAKLLWQKSAVPGGTFKQQVQNYAQHLLRFGIAPHEIGSQLNVMSEKARSPAEQTETIMRFGAAQGESRDPSRVKTKSARVENLSPEEKQALVTRSEQQDYREPTDPEYSSVLDRVVSETRKQHGLPEHGKNDEEELHYARVIAEAFGDDEEIGHGKFGDIVNWALEKLGSIGMSKPEEQISVKPGQPITKPTYGPEPKRVLKSLPVERIKSQYPHLSDYPKPPYEPQWEDPNDPKGHGKYDELKKAIKWAYQALGVDMTPKSASRLDPPDQPNFGGTSKYSSPAPKPQYQTRVIKPPIESPSWSANKPMPKIRSQEPAPYAVKPAAKTPEPPVSRPTFGQDKPMPKIKKNLPVLQPLPVVQPIKEETKYNPQWHMTAEERKTFIPKIKPKDMEVSPAEFKKELTTPAPIRAAKPLWPANKPAPKIRKDNSGKSAGEVATEPVQYDPKILKKELKETADGIKIFYVDGKAVRDNIDINMLGGTNGMACSHYVPADEIWIEKGIKDADAIITHELAEYKLMNGGMSYDEAHAQATQIEEDFRQRRKKQTGK